MERNVPALTLNNPAGDLLPMRLFPVCFVLSIKARQRLQKGKAPPQHSPIMRIKVVRPRLPALLSSRLCFEHVVRGDIEST